MKCPSPHKTKGFTLVELLVALVLGLVILGGVLSIFSETRRSFRLNENLSRVQENARFGFEVLARELREAGSTPCGTRAMANVIRDSGITPWYADWSSGTIQGYDDTQATPNMAPFGTATGNRVSGTDAILSLRNLSDEASIRTVTTHEVADDAFTVQPNPNPYYGEADLISVCDGKSGAILQISTVSNSLSQLEYGLADLNCANKLGYPTGPCSAASPAKTFNSGAIITRYDPVFWYVGFNSTQQRSLYRLNVVTEDASGVKRITTNRQEMISGIQNMQIEYLVRDAAAANTLATSWISASNAIFDAAAGGWSESNSKQVVATRITLTLNSEENVGATGLPLQRQFISVAALRSRDIP